MVAGLAKLPRYQPAYEIQHDLSICSEPARSRFDPRNSLSCGVRLYLKLIKIFVYKGLHWQVNVHSVHSVNSCLGCGDRVTEWLSAGQQSN